MEPEPDNAEGDGGEVGVLCPKCLLANSPETAFCTDCGAPIGMVSAIDPLQHIYAEGFAYRQAVDGPPKFIILAGMWMMFFPVIFVGPVMILQDRGYGPGDAAMLYIEVFCCLISLACAVLLYRVTKNYVVKNREIREADSSAIVE